MTDHPETLAPYRMPWRRDQVKQLGPLTPMLRYVPKNPLFLIGAAVIGVAGVLAWRNRDRIASAAGPVIDDARAKGQALIEDAKHKGEELIEQAKTTGEAVAAKVKRTRRTTTDAPTAEIH
jgi:hypothetical protein